MTNGRPRPRRFVWPCLGLVLACGLAGLTSLAHGQGPLVVITGRVVAADTGAPIRNARVAGPPAPGTGWQEEVRTDAEGRFRIQVPSVLPSVRVSKPGLVNVIRAARPGDETLIVMSRGAALTIHVVDAAFVPRRARITMTTVRDFGGSPMAAAGLSTDERGVLRVGNLSAGEYALGIGGGASVRLPGPLASLTDEQFAKAREETARALAAANRNSVDLAQMVTLRTGEEASVFLVDLSPASSGAPDAPAPPAPRGEINGSIADEYGDPVQDAVVLLLEPRAAASGAVTLARRGGTATDDRGMFRIGAVERGTYYVFTSGERMRPGDTHLFFPGRVSVGEAQPIDVAEGEKIEGIDVRLSPALGARLAVTVLDSRGRPLSRATVVLRGVDASGGPVVTRIGPTAPSGQFEFRNVAPGLYTLDVNPLDARRRADLLRPPGIPQNAASTPPESASVTVRVAAGQPGPLTIRTLPVK